MGHQVGADGKVYGMLASLRPAAGPQTMLGSETRAANGLA